MPTNSMNDYSTTPASNTNIAGTDISVGCAPENVGVFLRTILSQIAYAVQGSGGAIPATWHVGTLYANTIVGATKYENLTFSGFVGTYDRSGDAVIEQISIAASSFVSATVENCTALVYFKAEDCTQLAVLVVDGCSSLITLKIAITALTSVDLTDCVALVDFDFHGNTGISSISVATNSQLLSVNGNACALNVTAVNNILIALDGFGLSNGAVSLTGGTNAAPTGAGITAKNNLTGKGWTVTTN